LIRHNDNFLNAHENAVIEKIRSEKNEKGTFVYELNVILSAIADTIAYNICPKSIFIYLFLKN
jgi:hypothetical protein